MSKKVFATGISLLPDESDRDKRLDGQEFIGEV